MPTVWADFYHDSENYAVFQAACQNNFVLWLRPNEPTLLKTIDKNDRIRCFLSKNAYLTPLAKDYARKHQLLT